MAKVRRRSGQLLTLQGRSTSNQLKRRRRRMEERRGTITDLGIGGGVVADVLIDDNVKEVKPVRGDKQRVVVAVCVVVAWVVLMVALSLIKGGR